MIEKLKYINHTSEYIDFGLDDVYANFNDLRNFAWHKDNGYFERENNIKTLPILILSNQTVNKRNRLFEIVEKDVLSNIFGKLYVNDFYLNCMIVGIENDDYFFNDKYQKLTLSIYCENPAWIKETMSVFRGGSTFTPNGNKRNLDFNYDFAYDYKSDYTNASVTNSSLSGANFMMYIFGACENPEIFVAGHKYKINASIMAGEYVVIDSFNKTITLVKSDSAQVNIFDKRDRTSDIFKKIGQGINAVTWNGQFGFDLKVFEERSEPLWT